MARRKRITQQKRKKKNSPSFVIDSRWQKICAVAMGLLGLYLFIALTSYLFHWKSDQDKVMHAGLSILFQSDVEVNNAMGKFGAFFSNKLFYKGFGIASFGFVYYFVASALGIFFEWSRTYQFKVFQRSLFFVLFLSPLAAFIFVRFGFPWGGAFGAYVTLWLTSLVGSIGTALLFVAVALAAFIWHFPELIPKSFPAAIWMDKLRFKSNHNEEIDNSQQVSEEIEKPAKKPKKAEIITNKAKPATLRLPESDKENELELEIEKKIKEPTVAKEEPTLELDEIVLATDKAELVDSAKAEKPLVIETESERQTPVLRVEEENVEHLEPYDPTLELSHYVHPSLDLLQLYEKDITINREELNENNKQIIRTLQHYKIEITSIRATVGPTITLYEIVPAPGVRISKIKNLEDDIALSLSALGIRIIAPIPGKGTIGIEVPNSKKQIVGLRDVLSSSKFQEAKMDLPIALGKTISDEVFIADLAKMPHLLIAGATGQGKSVGINTIITSLLYKKHPSQLKIVMVDPKKVELYPYSAIDKHFLACLPNVEEPVITETKTVVHTLTSLCMEMDIRYDLLKKAHTRNIKEYNKKFIARKLNPTKGHRFLPFIVLVIDEFADLIMTAGKEVELSIARLAQLARAVGIHLIIATQRPSVNIITGVIKANFPARIAFRVASKVDSRTILDAGGADQLIGRGDMLLNVGGDMIRLQCAFVDTPEVERVIQHIANQQGYPEPFFLPECEDSGEGGAAGSYSNADLDENFMDAARLIVQNQHGSTSMIQRKLKLGYNRAGRIMDQLEAFGIVGSNEGSKAREVLITTEMELETHLEQIRSR